MAHEPALLELNHADVFIQYAMLLLPYQEIDPYTQ